MSWKELSDWLRKVSPQLIEKCCQLEMHENYFAINRMFYGKDKWINFNCNGDIVVVAIDVSYERMKVIIENLFEVEDD